MSSPSVNPNQVSVLEQCMPLTPMQRHLCTSGWLAMALWMVVAFFGTSVLAYLGITVPPNGHLHLYAHLLAMVWLA